MDVITVFSLVLIGTGLGFGLHAWISRPVAKLQSLALPDFMTSGPIAVRPKGLLQEPSDYIVKLVESFEEEPTRWEVKPGALYRDDGMYLLSSSVRATVTVHVDIIRQKGNEMTVEGDDAVHLIDAMRLMVEKHFDPPKFEHARAELMKRL